MWISKTNKNYTAKLIGTKMSFFYKEELECELIVRTSEQARQLLIDRPRLRIPPAQIQFRYDLITDYVGATVDDITVSEDGNTHYLNGKPIS